MDQTLFLYATECFSSPELFPYVYIQVTIYAELMYLNTCFLDIFQDVRPMNIKILFAFNPLK
jgi:hypothetical protein